MRFGIDLTACWRERIGMVTLAVDLSKAILAQLGPADAPVLFASRERPPGFEQARAQFVLSPHRHELANKLRWFPGVEAQAGLDAMLYPYWPGPPRRHRGAPPAVMYVHDLAFRMRAREVPWQQRAYLGALFPRTLPSAAAVLVPTEATRADLLNAYRLAPERVHVVPEAPAELGPPGRLPAGLEAGRYLLAVGTIEPRKNYPRLVAAFRLLRERLGADTPELVVVGRTGWAYGNALDLLRSTPGVRPIGHVADGELVALYRGALALAFPSLYEGFGLPLLEAMREGTPVLVGRDGALPEVAGGAALAVDAEDEEAIAGGLGRLVQDEVLRADLSRRGRARAAEFSWERSAARTLEVMRRVAG